MGCGRLRVLEELAVVTTATRAGRLELKRVGRIVPDDRYAGFRFIHHSMLKAARGSRPGTG